jgi:hypothetical protein
MNSLPDNVAQSIISEYVDDEKVLSLALAVMYWSSVGQNPNTTPPQEGKILGTAQKFYQYITG